MYMKGLAALGALGSTSGLHWVVHSQGTSSVMEVMRATLRSHRGHGSHGGVRREEHCSLWMTTRKTTLGTSSLTELSFEGWGGQC